MFVLTLQHLRLLEIQKNLSVLMYNTEKLASIFIFQLPSSSLCAIALNSSCLLFLNQKKKE
jgi:hypothetical protein